MKKYFLRNIEVDITFLKNRQRRRFGNQIFRKILFTVNVKRFVFVTLSNVINGFE